MKTPKDKLLQIEKYIVQKKFGMALAKAEVLVRLYPDDPIVYSPAAICYSEMGDEKKALDVLRTAQKRFPKNPDILYYLAETLNQLERYEEAEKVYREALDLTPAEFKEERSQCYNGLGVSLWEQHFRIQNYSL
jgi:Flp pilus assembly protein TadD